MKVALVHDSLTQLGGAERVLEVLHEMYPSAPVYVLVCSRELKEKFSAWDIRTSWLQPFYNVFPKFQYFFPIIPLALKTWNFGGYDLVVSSSSSFAKNISVPKGVCHINYCHTPTRFLWLDQDYVSQELLSWLKLFTPLVRLMLLFLKKWDYKGAKRVSAFVANSKEVKTRINRFYGRESEVINPPVDTEFWYPTQAKKDYFLLAGRLQAHKNNEIVIRTFNRLRIPLHVVGTGRQELQLRSMAGPNIKFFGRVSDETLRDEYSGALGYIYPQVEDFGLMPLEAAGCGTATLAVAKGGSLETVVPGVTGEFFEENISESLEQKVRAWDASAYRKDALTKHASAFGKQVFVSKMQQSLETNFKKYTASK